MKSWQEELRDQAEKYHRIGAWVAIVLNPIWAIQDYFEIPEYWIQFLIIRCSVALLSLAMFFLYKPLKLGPEWLIYVPFLGIALQNAYMYSVMDVEILQKHTFAYIALFIGAGMLVLWKPIYSISIVVINLIVSIILFAINSDLEVGEILINGGMLTATVSIFTILLIHTRYNLTNREIKARMELQESKKEIEEKNRNITDSIKYAKKIQEAILPADELLDAHLGDYFVLYKPKDIVCGDFYWFAQQKGLSFIAAVDCTGHGVPGAFMSMIGNTLLNEIVIEKANHVPGEALDLLREGVVKALQQSGESERKEGMDLSLCAINFEEKYMDYAGANNPIYIVRNGELIEIKANRQPVGLYYRKMDKPFTNHRIEFQPGDILYLFSDGFPDQFGGPDGGKYMYKKFKNYLVSVSHLPPKEQKDAIWSEFLNWKGDLDQIDDICIIGIKIP